MHAKLKNLIGDLAPPIVLRGANALFAPRRRPRTKAELAGEKGAEWYDASFDACEHWSQHYTESEYYFLWSIIVDRIARSNSGSILEIGCGTGQLACVIRDRLHCQYRGFDFSEKRIQYAQEAYPDISFVRQDAFNTDLFETCDYDTIVCTEFLEHVESDTVVLDKIRAGSRFYGTVPNFPFVSHVRHFGNEDEVRERYGSHFRDLRIDTFLADAHGKAFYLLDGEVT